MRTWDSEVFLLRADSREDLLREGDELRRRLAVEENIECRDLAYTLDCVLARDAPLCLAVVAASLPELDQKLEDALERLADLKTNRIKERRGIYFFDSPLGPSGDLAFLFPGEGSQYRNMLADLCLHFPEVREWFDLIDRAFANHPRHYLPSQVIFGPADETAEQEARLWQMDCGSEANFAANQALFTLLSNLEIRPGVVVGHSAGEYSAMYAAGAVHISDREQIIQLIRSLNDVYEGLRQRGQIPEGELCAVSAPEREAVVGLVEQSGGRLFLAMDNCPHQIVLYGASVDMEKAKSQLVATGAMCNSLPFNRAYHTPLFAPFTEAVADFVRQLNLQAPTTEIYSGMTAQPYPRAPEAMGRLAAEYWMRPVRFRETVEAMYAAGVRLFVEVGARGNLTSFVDDTLRGRPYAAMPANVMSRSGIEQLNHLIALLAAHRVPMNLNALFARRSPREVSLQATPTPVKRAEADRSVRLLSSLPVLKLAPERHVRVVQPAAAAVAARPEAAAVAARPEAAASPRSAAMSRYLETMQKFLDVNEEVVQTLLKPRGPKEASPTGRHAAPFIGRIVSMAPGRALTATRVLNLDEDIFLRDHVLGGTVSAHDTELTALPVMPLTMSLEMLAEAAATLFPEKRIVGLKDVRAYRWIALPEGSLPLRMTARIGNSWREVAVQITLEETPDTPTVEGVVLLDDVEPAEVPASDLPLASSRAPRMSSDDLYSTGMFHGPRFQGVTSVDRIGDDGVEATLRVLPTDSLFHSESRPRLLTDPVLLDAAGQVIGYWAMETCERAFNVFPFRVDTVELHPNPLQVGDLATCRARVHVTDSLIRSDIEVVAQDGRRLARLAGWEDRRFDLPESLFRLRVSPRDQMLASPWMSPITSLPDAQAYVCCRVDDVPSELLRGHGRIWEQVLAHLVLSRRERKVWRDLATAVDRRRHQWLLGRCAGKDAVRMLLKARHGLQLFPADVEIEQDVHGRPRARGLWAEQVDTLPSVSLSHIDGLAVAIATDRPCLGVGIDVERVTDRHEALPDVAFTIAERDLVRELGESAADEWVLRFWCAKEAVLKALGRGLAAGPKAAVITDVDQATGALTVSLSSKLQALIGLDADIQFTAYSGREGDLVFASAAYEPN